MNNFSKKSVLDDMREYLRKWNITDDTLAQKVADTTVDIIEKASEKKEGPIKVFLSLPMSGRSDEEIQEDINLMKIEILLRHPFGDESIIFVDNLDCGPVDTRDAITPALLYLGEALKKMSECNVVVFHHRWERAKGCMVEYEACLKYGIPAYELTWGINEVRTLVNASRKR